MSNGINRDSFPDGSIGQLIYDYWNGKLEKEDFEEALKDLDRSDLVYFITMCQSKGIFKGFCHP